MAIGKFLQKLTVNVQYFILLVGLGDMLQTNGKPG